MKKTIAFLLAIMLLCAVLAGCGSGAKKPSGSGDAPKDVANKNDDDDAPEGLETLEGFLDEFNRLNDTVANDVNSDAVTGVIKMDSMMAIANINLVALPAATYRMLDVMDKDGQYGDKNAETGFFIKTGNQYTFGIDGTPAAEDNAAMGIKKGQKSTDEGAYDGSTGMYRYQSIKDNGGAKTYQLQGYTKAARGNYVVMYIKGGEKTERDDAYTHYMFALISEGKLEFVFAKSTQGPDFPAIEFNPAWSLTDAKVAFEGAGAAIYHAGTIEDGAFTEQ